MMGQGTCASPAFAVAGDFMLNLKLMSVLVTCLLFMAALAIADEVVITHRSGKVQIIPIEEKGDPVEQVSFRRSVTQPQSTSAAAPVATPAPAKVESQKKSETPQKSGRLPIKVRWAEPMDPQ
jgi:hypothetical protein